MSNINAINLENYNDRKVVIQAIGSFNQKRKGNYTVIVSYSRLSQTIQQISRTGGRIVNVSINSSSLIAPEISNNRSNKVTSISQLNVPESVKNTQDTIVTETEKLENKLLKQLKITEPEASQKNKKANAKTAIASTKIENKSNKPRRKKLQFAPISQFRKTTINTAKIRGKKPRRRSKISL